MGPVLGRGEAAVQDGGGAGSVYLLRHCGDRPGRIELRGPRPVRGRSFPGLFHGADHALHRPAPGVQEHRSHPPQPGHHHHQGLVVPGQRGHHRADVPGEEAPQLRPQVQWNEHGERVRRVRSVRLCVPDLFHHQFLPVLHCQIMQKRKKKAAVVKNEGGKL